MGLEQFKKIRECYETFSDVLRCSDAFQGIPESSKVFSDFLRFFVTF